jgi:hypothetical protein
MSGRWDRRQAVKIGNPLDTILGKETCQFNGFVDKVCGFLPTVAIDEPNGDQSDPK